jgi:hypothetical protein
MCDILSLTNPNLLTAGMHKNRVPDSRFSVPCHLCTIWNLNLIHEIKRKVILDNGSQHCVQNFCLLCCLKALRLEHMKLKFCLWFCMCNLTSHIREHRLRVLENRAVWTLFGPKRDYLTWGCRGLIRNVYRILVRKQEGKRPLGRSRCMWSDKSNMDWTDLSQVMGMVFRGAKHGNKPSGLIK